MAKIIYHRGTGTYFGLDDDVVVIDTDEVTENIDAELMDMEGDEIAVYWGKRIVNVITEDKSSRRTTDMKRYRTTMTITIDVLADNEQEATQIAGDSYFDWDHLWMPDSTVEIPEDDDDFYPVNEEDN